MRLVYPNVTLPSTHEVHLPRGSDTSQSNARVSDEQPFTSTEQAYEFPDSHSKTACSLTNVGDGADSSLHPEGTTISNDAQGFSANSIMSATNSMYSCIHFSDLEDENISPLSTSAKLKVYNSPSDSETAQSRLPNEEHGIKKKLAGVSPRYTGYGWRPKWTRGRPTMATSKSDSQLVSSISGAGHSCKIAETMSPGGDSRPILVPPPNSVIQRDVQSLNFGNSGKSNSAVRRQTLLMHDSQAANDKVVIDRQSEQNEDAIIENGKESQFNSLTRTFSEPAVPPGISNISLAEGRSRSIWSYDRNSSRTSLIDKPRDSYFGVCVSPEMDEESVQSLHRERMANSFCWFRTKGVKRQEESNVGLNIDWDEWTGGRDTHW